MSYKEPKLFGKNQDGFYLGKIEQIGTGRETELLMISNRKPNLWIFNLLNGYRQIGTYNSEALNEFQEGQNVIVELFDNEVISVMPDTKDNYELGLILNESYN